MPLVTICGFPAAEYAVCAEGRAPSLSYAGQQLDAYLTKLCGNRRDGTRKFVLNVDTRLETDEFYLTVDGDVYIRGGARGIIYGVYEFLEQAGVRFFAPGLERLPRKKVAIGPINIHQKPVIRFRDILDSRTGDRDWSLKNRLNSNLWGVRQLDDRHGGGYDFVGAPAHNLTGEYLMKPYVDTHPEFFSLVNGKRLTDKNGQICATNMAAAEAAAKELCRLFVSRPDASFAALSQGDNHNFCQCRSCRQAYAEKGKLVVYLEFLNVVAGLVAYRFPNRKLVMLAYEDILGIPDDFRLADNILVQYCTPFCRAHSADDVNCEHNAAAVRDFRRWVRASKGIWIWDYVNCFKYELMPLLHFDHLLRNIRFYAENNAEGIFNEGGHRNDASFANCAPLRNYLLAKAMWNPFMSDEQWNRHKNEFLQAYFGKGGESIAAYLSLIHTYGNRQHMNYNDCQPGSFTNWTPVPVIEPQHFIDFVKIGRRLLKTARDNSPVRARSEVEKMLTAHLYYELFYSMSDILRNGTAREIEAVKARNAYLIDCIISQKLTLTFWGEGLAGQNERLQNCKDIPPSEWNYSW